MGLGHGAYQRQSETGPRGVAADLGSAEAGEGLVGFAWAFLRAGAQRVIAGLWDVDDRSTADLMGRVYAEIALGRRAFDAMDDWPVQYGWWLKHRERSIAQIRADEAAA